MDASFLGRLPQAFVENLGQTDPRAKFVMRSGQQTLWLTRGGVVFDLLRRQPDGSPGTAARPRGEGRAITRERLVFTQEFDGVSRAATMESAQPLPGVHNYFLGNDRARWRTGVRSTSVVVYRDAWEGIDIRLVGTGGRLEQEFIVRAGADPAKIRVTYHGIEGLRVGEDGSLAILTAFGELRESPPTIYQEIDGRRVAISGRFKLLGSTSYTFEVGPYQRQVALVIDPTISYATYLGGAASEGSPGLAVDVAGSAYLAGVTTSLDFPTANGLQPFVGGTDLFVAKLTASGDALFYSTYFGGAGDESDPWVAVDSAGSAYVAGSTSSTNFPIFPTEVLQATSAGGRDGFAIRLDAQGGLAYSTYLGGSGDETGLSVAVEPGCDPFPSGCPVYIAGTTASADFPTVAGALQPRSGGGRDTFVARLDASGAQLVAATYLGGDGADDAGILGIGPDGAVHLTGQTASTNFPTRAPLQPSPRAPPDAFVTKLSPDLSALVYSTYLGGSAADAGTQVAVDGTGHAYVAGWTSSTDFRILNALQATLAGDVDAFVAKLDPSGTIVVYSTYLGGRAVDDASGIAVDQTGSVHVTGKTASRDFPMVAPTQSAHAGGPFDAFVAKIDPLGRRLVYSTYLGGPGDEEGGPVALDVFGPSFYTAIQTTSPGLPSDGLPFAGGQDLYLARIVANALDPDVAVTAFANPSPVLSGTNLTYSISVVNNGPEAATTTTLTDAIPAGTTFQSLTPSTGCTLPPLNGTGTVTCALGTLANGARVDLTLVVRVTAAAPGVVTNTVSVSLPPGQDPNEGNNSATVVTNIVAGGFISGTVCGNAPPPCSAPGGPNPPIATAQLTIRHSVAGTQMATATTNGSGVYVAGPLLPGNYKVTAEAHTWGARVYDNQPNFTLGNVVTVTSGNTRANTNFGLPGSAGGITGKVTESDGVTPVPNASVAIRGPGGDQIIFMTTDAAGIYNPLEERRLDAGNYLVRVIRSGFPTTYYVASHTVASATPVAVVANQVTRNIDVRLTSAVGGIKGRITDAVTGAPIANANVQISDGATGSLVLPLNADAAGRYDTGLALAPGQYKVSASFSGFELIAHSNRISVGTGDPVTVTAGETTTIDIALPALGGITGFVRNAADNAPISGAIVDVFDYASNNRVGGTTVLGDGTYTVGGLNPLQAYRVRARVNWTSGAGNNFATVFANNKLFAGTADIIMVPLAGNVTVNVLLNKNAGGISGVITDTSGQPVDGAIVDVFDGANTNFSITSFVTGGFGGTTWITDVNGNFNTGRVLAPGSYKVRARKTGVNLIQTLHSNPDVKARDLSTATPVVVGNNTDTTANIAVPAGGTISGFIRDQASGQALQGATVIARRVASSGFFIANSATTGPGGFYSISGLHPGEWLVTAQATGRVQAWYGGAPNTPATDFSSATPVVIDGTNTAVVDMNLPIGGAEIRGRVTRKDNGQPAPVGTSVSILGPWPRNSTVSPGTALTDAQGDFSFSGIPPGRYMVQADGFQIVNGTAIGFWPATAIARASAVPIAVTHGDVVTVDLQVPGFTGGAQARTIRGTLRDSSGQPIRSAQVFALEPTAGTLVRPDVAFDDGGFVMDGLPPGRYLLNVNTEQTFVTTNFPAELTSSSATVVDVTAGDVNNINVVLPSTAGTITGTITRSDTGQPVLGASVSVRNFMDFGSGGATSRANGTFLVRGVAAGSYKVRVSAPGFVTKYYKDGVPGGVRTHDEGSFITVPVGAATPNINVILDPTGGALTGTVRREDTLAPVVATLAIIHDADNDSRVMVVSTDATGTWRTEGLGPGNYKVQIADLQDARHGTRWYNGEPTLLDADPVAVAAAGVTGGIDVLVSPDRGAISGTVFHLSGEAPLPNAVVEILDAATGGHVRRAISGSNGTWLAQGLAPGTNLYVARARALGFADEFFANVPVLTLAASLSVANGATTPAGPIVLTRSGDITGTITYAGAQGGSVVVELYTNAALTQKVYETVIAGPGAYGFKLAPPDTRGLLPGTYFVKAYRDSDDDSVQDPTEAVGRFGAPDQVVVTENATLSGRNFAIADPAATTNTAPTAREQEVIFVQGSADNRMTLGGFDAETTNPENLTYTIVTNPLHGTLAPNGNPQQRLYTPVAGFSGTDTFTFTVTDRGDPDNCGAPGPLCAPPLTSPPATVTIEVIPSAGTTNAGLDAPAVAVNSDNVSLGNIEIVENAPGQIAAGSQVRLSLPPGLAFQGPPVVSLSVDSGAAVSPATLLEPGVAAFTVLTASTGGRASILVSGIVVDVPPGFLSDGVTTAAILTTISGPGLTTTSVQNAIVVAPEAGPVITDVEPAAGAQGASGHVVMITGANFGPATATVSFGPGVTATAVVDSPNQITATLNVIAGATLGPRNVTVTNGGSGQSVTRLNGFAVTPPPTVTSVSNLLAQDLPNQLLTIHGTNFGPPTRTPSNLVVTFSPNSGLIVPRDVGFTDSTTLTVRVDVLLNAPLGPVNVTITNPDGGRATGIALTSVIEPTNDQPAGRGAAPASQTTSPPPPSPNITGLLPNAAALGATIRIGGSGFSATAANNSVTFASATGTRITAPVTAASTTQLTVTVPAQAAAGNVTVAVGGIVSNGTPFTVTSPALANVLPASGARGAVVPLTLTGARFLAGATVTFSGALGDIVATGSPVVSADGKSIQMSVSVAAAAVLGLRNVTVTNPGGAASTLAGGFQVLAPVVAGFQITLPTFPDAATYLPSVGQVTVTRDANGLCTGKTVVPVSVQLQARFTTTAGLQPPASVTFSIAPSAHPGTAYNESCEVAPFTLASPSPDFSIGQAALTSQNVVATHAGGGLYLAQLFSHDRGGKVTVTVTGSTGGVAATGTLTLPIDTDGDDLPDAYEKNAGLNADKAGVSVLNFLSSDANGNGIGDRNERFARDGLSNWEKYRGVYLVGPLPGRSGTMASFERLGAGMRHFFVRGRGFGDDPAIQAGFCGMDAATFAPVADATLSASNPCPRFQVGAAYQEIGVAVHNVTGSFTTTTELPRTSYMGGVPPAPLLPAPATLDMMTVFYDAVRCSGSENCDTTSKFGVRQWQFSTLGFSSFGTPTAYGATVRIFKRAVEAYFRNRPYQHRINDPTRVVLSPTGVPMLAPITRVGDSSGTGADNGFVNTGDVTVNGQLAGDAYVPGSFVQQLSALDVNNDSCVELPNVPDPTTLPRCNPGATAAEFPQATKQMVVTAVITHETGHATGVNTHTADPLDIMYQYTINWTRANHFSPTAAGLVQIHNKGLQ